jgi:hypothetical protein
VNRAVVRRSNGDIPGPHEKRPGTSQPLLTEQMVAPETAIWLLANVVSHLKATLEREREHTHALLTAVEWARMRDRFHALDGIKNDRCPSCGGRVGAEETETTVRLRSIT